MEAGFSVRAEREENRLPWDGKGVKVGWFWVQGLGFGDPLGGSMRQRRRPLASSPGELDVRHLGFLPWQGFRRHMWGMRAQTYWILGPVGTGIPEGSAVSMIGFPLCGVPGATSFLTVGLGIRINLISRKE